MPNSTVHSKKEQLLHRQFTEETVDSSLIQRRQNLYTINSDDEQIIDRQIKGGVITSIYFFLCTFVKQKREN